MIHKRPEVVVLFIVTLAALSGCCSPYRSDRGALMGGLLGAGTGAAIGDALGNAGAGAAIGAGVGALSGAAIGQELDNIEAANRQAIEQQLGRQIAAGAVRMEDVVAMAQAGVDEELIVSHIQTHGAARPLTTDDVIFLHQQGVSSRVIKALQSPPQPARAASYQQPAPAPVIVEEHHYGPPVWWGPPPRWHHRHHYRYRHRQPGVSWGLSFSN
jgi:hypothetical protein